MYILLITNRKEPKDSTFFKCSSLDQVFAIKSNYDRFLYSFELISDYKSISI